ncbi:ParB/RepB/Spo0J family partition protein [Solirubrobacter phytolaccae]|uniref:ParB/RepB/Spo0J family partition protein n=1 Tax=Solirubrobacter phytolaccae TaxID=1404360 RepID=A0A9X3NFU7_9ACTN|nr:ParB/RepB/Spo0J family partition protein [Solirubrobacter phytolaccae]MDA0184260.1 ParB/RepB/Spo0J family partition protein [Solirubrobacter phytolaccae]
MAERPRGMGRGLAAILAPTEGVAPAAELRQLPVDLIAPNPRQPRQVFDEAALLGLSESVKERGVLQPVLVRPCPGGSYELIAGERRWRAAQLAGLEVVPAVVQPHEDRESLEIALIENMAREDLNPIEEARACSLLVDELGLTREEVGRRVGRSRVAVSNLLRILDLPDEVLDMLIEGRLTEGHGRALLMAPDHGDRRRLARSAADEEWTVRETEARARETTRPAEPVKAGRELHPDQEEAASRIGDVFLRAFGADVKVKPRGAGYTVALTFESLDEALELASRFDRA